MNLLITPKTTEKAYGLSQNNIYVFDVPVSANKQAIMAAVTAQYGVEVTNIKTLVQNGKAVRFSRGKNRYPGNTVRKNSKKAYVTLKQGDSIKVFETPEPAKEKK
jgi:ribosomal protein L23